MGDAMRFIVSAPAPVAQSIGSKPRIMVATVMALGRTRVTAPSRIASVSVLAFHRPPDASREPSLECRIPPAPQVTLEKPFAAANVYGEELKIGVLPVRKGRCCISRG